MTSEERSAYVRGALETLVALDLDCDRCAEVCADLGLTMKDLEPYVKKKEPKREG